MKKLAALASATAILGVGLVAAPAATAAPSKPDTACMQAGISFLKDAGVFTDVAREGLPVALAVAVGVEPRAGVSVDPAAVLPLSVVLADHRAGDDSLFIYPWCD